MDKRESRKNFNIMARKFGDCYNIVRYVNGFSKEPVVLFRGITNRSEVLGRLEKALKIISSISSNFGVLIQPSDKSQMVEIAMIIEDSGIAVNDIRVQKNGVVYFLSKGESDSVVRTNVEDVLTEANIPFNKNTVTITRPDLMPKDDKEDKPTPSNPEAFTYTDKDTVYLQTNPNEVDSSITSESSVSEEELSVDSNVSDDSKNSVKDFVNSMISSDMKFDRFDDVISYLLTNGFDIDNIVNVDEKLILQLLK